MKLMKISLNKVAQEMLFGYLEGVDWQIDLTIEDSNGVERYMTKKEQNYIHSKVCNWINDYRKKYNGKFAILNVDEDIAYYLSSDASNQSDLISSEIFGHDVEDIFEEYWCYKTKRQKTRIKFGKENLYKDYKLAQKQLDKLSKIKL